MLLITDRFEMSEVQFHYSDVPKIEEINPMKIWDLINEELENTTDLPALRIVDAHFGKAITAILENYNHVATKKGVDSITKEFIRTWSRTPIQPFNRYQTSKILFVVFDDIGSEYGRWFLIDFNHTYKQKER